MMGKLLLINDITFHFSKLFSILLISFLACSIFSIFSGNFLTKLSSFEKTRVLGSLNIRFNYRAWFFDGILKKFGTKKD